MSINWKIVKPGTNVMFRRSSYAQLERGKWTGGITYGTKCLGAICFFDEQLSIELTINENGDWRIDPFWLKLA